VDSVELEQTIRTTLTERWAEEFLTIYGNPEFIEQNNEWASDLAESVSTAIIAYFPLDDFIEEEVAPILADGFRQRFTITDSKLKAYNLADQMLKSRGQHEEVLNELYGLAEEHSETGNIANAFLREAAEPILLLIDKLDLFVSYMVQVGFESSLASALAPELEYEAMRSVFPTKEDYLAFSTEYNKAIDDFMEAATLSGAMIGEEAGGLIQVMSSVIQEYAPAHREIRSKFWKPLNARRVAAIYNSAQLLVELFEIDHLTKASPFEDFLRTMGNLRIEAQDPRPFQRSTIAEYKLFLDATLIGMYSEWHDSKGLYRQEYDGNIPGYPFDNDQTHVHLDYYVVRPNTSLPGRQDNHTSIVFPI